MAEIPNPRILIVDDESRQMAALCDTLRDHGYETTGCGAGVEALAALRESRYDLMLTDLMMPGMNGIELLRAAQEIEPDLVGIVMTGHGTIGTAVEAMKAGALDYIVKPFKLSAVIPVLSRAMTVRRLRLENAELEARVRLRTTELETANESLAEANRELEAFSYSVSHDLRAPLRHIDGYSRMLLENHAAHLPPDAQRMLVNVSKGAERLGLLIDDLLNFARLSRQALSKDTVNMRELVDHVLADLQREREGRPIEIKIGNLPDCVGDLALLRQVFVNLLSNAIKFTRGREQALIEIGCREEADDLIYSVKDNGAGFDMRYAQKLFGVFQRLHRPDEFEGTGVGLSIVHRIVLRHGGRIWAEAEVGHGAAFHFTLPRAAVAG